MKIKIPLKKRDKDKDKDLVDALAVLALLPIPALAVWVQSILVALAAGQEALAVCIALVPAWTERVWVLTRGLGI